MKQVYYGISQIRTEILNELMCNEELHMIQQNYYNNTVFKQIPMKTVKLALYFEVRGKII